MIILRMRFKVLCKLADSFGYNRDLHLWGSCILLVLLMFIDDFLFLDTLHGFNYKEF